MIGFLTKSAGRFMFILTLAIILTVSGVNLLLGFTTEVNGASEPQYTEVEICAGDTLWTIARDYMPKDMDIREAVYELRLANDMTAHDPIYAGQTLLIPKYE